MKYSQIDSPGSSVHLAEAENFYAVICLRHEGRGPALGGCRLLEYPSRLAVQEEAIRLAGAMSEKAIAARVPYDGGKAVIMRPPGEFDRLKLLQRFAGFVEHLQGRYITTVDSGTTSEDMAVIRRSTSYVTGFINAIQPYYDPSPSTAYGVMQGMRAAIKAKLGHEDFHKLHIAVQGLGNVGYRLAGLLHAAGARLTVSDVNLDHAQRCAKRLQAELAAPELIHQVPCDIFSPCALGRILNAFTIGQLKCRIVAGAANDQLANPGVAGQLNELGISYVPDYLINAGGLIHLDCLLRDQGIQTIEQEVDKIYGRVSTVLTAAQNR